MTFPAITAFYAALFAVLLVALSTWVVAGRARFKVHHGDGGNDALNRRIRAHANFAEHVPLCLLLAALLELKGAGSVTMHGLLLTLLVARLIHPFGMIAPTGSLQQYGLRATTVMATWLILLATAGLLLAG